MRNKKAFTLAEIMVVIGIIAIVSLISLVLLPNNNKRRKQAERAARQAAADIRQMQNYALTGKQETSLPPGEKICGFGAYFNTDTNYVLYYNHAANTDDCPNRPSDYNPLSPYSTDVISKNLSDGTTMSFDGNPTAYFFIPFATTVLTYSGMPIIFKNGDDAYYTVCVFTNGVVEEREGQSDCS